MNVMAHHSGVPLGPIPQLLGVLMVVYLISFWKLLLAEGQVLSLSHYRSSSLPTKGPCPMTGQCRTIKPKSLSLKVNNFERLSQGLPVGLVDVFVESALQFNSPICSALLPSLPPGVHPKGTLH